MRLSVTAPATTANLGAGFDVFGAALALDNRFTVETGRGGFSLSGGGDISGLGQNLFLAGLEAAAARLGHRAPSVAVMAEAAVPLRSGLGSSASAICAGILAAQALIGRDLPDDEVLRIASVLDGHPDNVAACLHGGVTIATEDGLVRRMPAPDLQAIIFYPGTEQGTEAARRNLAPQIDRKDAVFNIGRASLLVYALTTGEYSLLSSSCEDRLHEPLRLAALPFAKEAREAALSAGALAMPISGSGPSLIALARPEDEPAVSAALEGVARRYPPARVLSLSFAERGARVEPLD
ncbi:MAG: homoserine kinase [Thermaerobacter sp.]|nr:homoserine kinase [Thermaerobacter sp.]